MLGGYDKLRLVKIILREVNKMKAFKYYPFSDKGLYLFLKEHKLRPFKVQSEPKEAWMVSLSDKANKLIQEYYLTRPDEYWEEHLEESEDK